MTKLDTTVAITAPEFIVFQYSAAGPSVRIFAALIDHLIIAFTLFMTLMFFALAMAFVPGKDAEGLLQFILFLVFFIVYWLYFFLFEWLNRGRTPGKMALHLRVASADGTAVDPSQLLIRNLVRMADMLPVLPLFWLFFIPACTTGALSMFLSGNSFQRLGDLAARTIVIRDEREKSSEIVVIQDARIKELAKEIHLKQMPPPDFVRALNEYMLRRPLLHPDRRAEICNNVRPFLDAISGYGSERPQSDELMSAIHMILFQMDSEKVARSLT